MGMETEQLVRVLMAERNKLLAYAWSITGDFAASEDVVQEVALLAMDKGREVADEARLRVWLRRSARFKALEALRAKRRTPSPLSAEVLEKLEAHWEPYGPPGEMSEATVAELLRACYRKLTSQQQRLLSLRYSKGLHSGEIAAQLDMKVETVYRALTRAHRNLADCVRGELGARQGADRDE
jgi:RNA polymerase sigma-70 factor, ECF subfamily